MSSILVLVLMPGTAAAECGKADCCIEKWCCSASKDCSYGCMCSFSCSTDPNIPSVCSCECVGGPSSIVMPVSDLAVSMSTDTGIKTTAQVRLKDLKMLLTKTTNWHVQIDSDVEDTAVPAHEWTGTFSQMIAAFASGIGVAYSFDETQRVLTFSSLD